MNLICFTMCLGGIVSHMYLISMPFRRCHEHKLELLIADTDSLRLHWSINQHYGEKVCSVRCIFPIYTSIFFYTILSICFIDKYISRKIHMIFHSISWHSAKDLSIFVPTESGKTAFSENKKPFL